MKDKIIFLDRDGTINKEVNYLYRKEDFEFIPNAPRAIEIFHELGYKVVIITNQAGVARGYYKEADIEKLHNYIDDLLKKESTYIDAYYYCPHHPDGKVKEYSYACSCRKPKTGMIEQAMKDYDVDLGKSIFVGDKEIDVETGKKAGIRRCYLVRSGHPVNENNTKADAIFNNILDIAIFLKQKKISVYKL